VEFTRFFNYYNNAQDLNAKASNEVYEDEGDSTRFFINVGAKDDFDWMSLKDFLKATLDLGRDDVNRVEVKDSFSFFNVDSSKAEEVLRVFQDFKHQGRHINVEITKKSAGKERSGRKGGGYKGKDKGSRSFDKSSKGADKGRRRSSDAPSGGRRRSTDSDTGGRKGKKSGGRSSSIESSIKRRRSKK
jgi:ATP-dependent RNA helicase DeaD